MNRKEFIASIREYYDIVATLSRKNDGEVLRLCHKNFSKEIVLRCYELPCEAYNLIKSVYHPNLPEVYDTLMLEDGQAVFEEYIDGMTVADILKSGTYSYRGAKRVLYEVCNGLNFLHSMNIIHRDIKPENVIISESGEVKLIDLNASRKFNSNKSNDTEVLGTVGYAAPEQQGIAQSDCTADIYSLGVLLNVMLTGKHPSEQLAKGKAGKIILKCTQIDPKSRFKTVEKLVEAL